MSDIIYWISELRIQEGKYEHFENLLEDIAAKTQREEPGALNYEWSISDDKKFCHVYERYVDSSAALAHMQAFGENQSIAEEFFTVFEPKRLMVYGNPSRELRDRITLFGGRIMSPLGGFMRLR